MERVKGLIRSFKDAIEEAEQRELNAKNSLRETEGNLDRLEGERTTLQNRVCVIGSEIDKINSRLEERSAKLDDAVMRTEESEERRRVLADTEIDDFERSEEIGLSMKATAELKEEAEHLVVQAERKVIVLENDLAKANERFDKVAAKVEELEECVLQSSDEIRDLEQKDRDASEREDIEFEKAKFLEVQLHETINTAEELERDAKKIERLKYQVLTEIENFQQKENEIRETMNSELAQMLNNI